MLQSEIKYSNPSNARFSCSSLEISLIERFQISFLDIVECKDSKNEHPNVFGC